MFSIHRNFIRSINKRLVDERDLNQGAKVSSALYDLFFQDKIFTDCS